MNAEPLNQHLNKKAARTLTAYRLPKKVNMNKATKLTRNFDFLYPLTHKVVRNLRITTEHVGDLHVFAQAVIRPGNSPDDMYEVDLDIILWGGTDIRPVLELTGLINDVYDAAMAHAMKEFSPENLYAA